MPGWGTLGLCGCGEGEANPAGEKAQQELNPASEARGGTTYRPQILVHLCILHRDSRRALLVQELGICRISCGRDILQLLGLENGIRAGISTKLALFKPV